MSFEKLRARLLALFLFWAVLLGALGAFTASRLQTMAGTLESVYRDRLVCQAQLRAVGDGYGQLVMAAVGRFQAGQTDAPAALSQITATQREAQGRWQEYLRTGLVDAETRLIAQVEPLLERADAATGEARRLIDTGDAPGLQAWARGPLPAAYAALGAAIDPLFALQQTVAQAEVERARQANRSATRGMVLLIVAGFVLGGLAAWALVKHYTAVAQHSEDALRRMNAFYTALSRTNHLIVRATDDATLLRELCRVCAETGHAGMTAVFLLDGHHAERFAADGPTSRFFADQPLRWDTTDPAYRNSPTAIALATGEHRVGRLSARDGRDNNLPPWRQRVQHHGIRAIAAFPIRRGGRVHGALTLYATEADVFDEDLVRLLTEMAGDVSFALDNLDHQAARLRLQQQTTRALERFQKLFQSSPVGCVITSLADTQVLEINDAMCRRFGVTRDAVVGTRRGKQGSLLVDTDAELFRERLMRDGRVQNMEARARLPDGALAIVIVNSETIEYQGQPCVMTMVLDITELRAAEAARQAHVAAEAANRAKTAFLSQMSHELRTPLNAMLGFTQLMQRDARSRLLPQDIEQLEHIRQAGWHLLSLVNDVMDVSRIESGQFEVRPAMVALAPLLDRVLRLNEAAAHSADVTVQGDRARHADLSVLADPVRLQQVFINLLSNAIKYNRPGGTVNVAVQAAAGRVVVDVADTGLGMSPEQLKHLYEPFNRLGRERGAIEGTGLGLALTRQLVGLMGGELVVESRLGEGTTARVTLPAAALAGSDAPGVTGHPPGSDADAREPHGTVLYIEDNDVNVLLIEQMLKRWSGVRFGHAPDGGSGIAQASGLRPDLVLLDMHLTDMDGIEVLRRLRADPRTATLRVVALSASDVPEDIENALTHGAADYWTKPVDLPRFLSGMQRHLSAAHLNAASQAGDRPA